MLIKQESIFSQKIVSGDFWGILNSVFNKGKYAMPLLFYGPEVLSYPSDEEKIFVEDFSKNSNYDDLGISLPAFPSKTYLKLCIIPVTPMLVKKVITNLDSLKASGPDCITVVVLKNLEAGVSYILAEFFNMCLRESCFPDC